jgi:hypothetical protein
MPTSGDRSSVNERFGGFGFYRDRSVTGAWLRFVRSHPS